MECPWLDERLQNLPVVARSHAPVVHELCAVAMHYRGVVPLAMYSSYKFYSTCSIPCPFHACAVHFHGSSTLDFHVATPLLCMLCAS